MNTQGNERLREMLAAEYALGTLRGGARRRFERWARSDEALRRLALEWSERLAPLIDKIPSQVPSRRVWEAIEARLPGFSVRRAGPSQATAWWDRLVLWRGLSAVFATIAVIALGIALRPAPLVEPRIVQVQTAPGAIATLLDPKSNQPVAMVMASEQGDALLVRVAAGVQVPEGKVLQLWMAPRDADGLLSMGVLPGDARLRAERVSGVDGATLARAKAFGLSLEPAGGSPQPTQVLGLGALVRLTI